MSLLEPRLGPGVQCSTGRYNSDALPSTNMSLGTYLVHVIPYVRSGHNWNDIWNVQKTYVTMAIIVVHRIYKATGNQMV